MIGQTIAVFFVLALLLLALYLLKRKGVATLNMAMGNRGAKQRQLRVLERVPLTPNHSLHLVHFQNRVLLIGVSPSGCTQLESFPHAELLGEGTGA